MEPDRAKEIIRALADGRDPATGEQFPPDSPYQQADTVRALYMALEAMGKGTRSRVPREVDPAKPKAGGSWSPEEEQQLRDAFTAHKPIPEIATAHGRTAGAITARLVRLGLIEDTAANRAERGNRLPYVASAKGGPTPPPAVSRPASAPPPFELTQEEKDNLPF